MYISRVEITNFRALQTISVPLSRFSVIIGENDVGKTSFLHALNKFFANKKLSDPNDWFMNVVSKEIRFVLTFNEGPDHADLDGIRRADGTFIISRVFPFDKPPKTSATLDDSSAVDVPGATQKRWFSSESFHFIPVHRDLAVQFSMNKTALLGKTLRAKMKKALEEGAAAESLNSLQNILTESINDHRDKLQDYLQEQMHNDAIVLGFDELEVDPIEGVKFLVSLSDDKAKGIPIQNRGAGTQNNLIIALFRLIADLNVGSSFIFAMEEPENSLHPKAQRQLLSVIREMSEDSQVIVTTHSAVFIDRSEFDNNIILTRTFSGNTIAKTFNMSMLEEVRRDMGIRASDALLKGGGNCAILVEGSTEEDGFPTFMEMLGMSEFKLGIAIIKVRGCDFQTLLRTATLLNAYEIPCVVVLDRNAQKTADDLERCRKKSLPNVKRIFCLSKGNIEDYYPLEIVAEVINRQFKPKRKLTAEDFDETLSGADRHNNFKKVMYEACGSSSLEYLKIALGGLGTRLMKEREMQVDPEIVEILQAVESIAES